MCSRLFNYQIQISLNRKIVTTRNSPDSVCVFWRWFVFLPCSCYLCLLPAGFLIVSGWFFLPCNVWIWGDKIDKCTLLSQVHTCFLSWTLRFRKNYITLACMFFAQLWLIFRELSPVSPLLKHSLCPNCHVSQTLTPVKSGNHFSSKHQTVLKIPVLSSWEKLPGNISNEFSHIH